MWGIADVEKFTNRIVTSVAREKMLQLSGKSMAKNYYKHKPVFCNDCIDNVYAKIPELLPEPATEITEPSQQQIFTTSEYVDLTQNIKDDCGATA